MVGVAHAFAKDGRSKQDWKKYRFGIGTSDELFVNFTEYELAERPVLGTMFPQQPEKDSRYEPWRDWAVVKLKRKVSGAKPFEG